MSRKAVKMEEKRKSPGNTDALSEDTENQDKKNKELIKRFQSGDNNALALLCENNYGFVRTRARKHIAAHGSDLSEEDLIQEGYIGLIRAAKKADTNREETFLAYAGWFIEQAMIQANNSQGFAIRFPEDIMNEISKVMKIDKELQDLNGEERLSALAARLNLPQKRVEELLHWAENLCLARVDKPVGDDGDDTSIIDYMTYDADGPFEKTDGLVGKEALKDAVSKVTHCLDEKEKRVIEMRFGLSGQKKHTLDEAAKVLNVPKERIRQLETKAMKKMRYFAREQGMKEEVS